MDRVLISPCNRLIGDSMLNVKIILHKAEEGGYWAEVPALPGCGSQGETKKETLANIKEAIELHTKHTGA